MDRADLRSFETVERTLLAAIRERVLHPEALPRGYLVESVKGHPSRFRARADDERRGHVELANVLKAILAGVVTETTGALLTTLRPPTHSSENM